MGLELSGPGPQSPRFISAALAIGGLSHTSCMAARHSLVDGETGVGIRPCQGRVFSGAPS